MRLLMQIIQVRNKYKTKVNLLADCRKLSGKIFNEDIINWLDTNIHKIYAMNKIEKKAFVASEDMTANLTFT
jgi:hypothetical protein